MTINKNNTGYTFLFSILMVLIVGTALAFTSLSLKPLQKKNAADKKMVDILGAIGVATTRGGAETDFPSYVKERLSINSDGNVLNSSSGNVDPADSSDPFNIDVKKDYRSKKPASELSFPLYVCESMLGDTVYVIPVVGSGLWGPIWGFVALESDMNTIYGAKFDHKTETPGLGAEIKDNEFSDKFKGQKLRDASPYFTILKGGRPIEDQYSVDGITGGTITSVGVGEMIDRTISIYQHYFESAINSSDLL